MFLRAILIYENVSSINGSVIISVSVRFLFFGHEGSKYVHVDESFPHPLCFAIDYSMQVQNVFMEGNINRS